MKVLIVADGRSPIACSWVESLREMTDWDIVWFSSQGEFFRQVPGVRCYYSTGVRFSSKNEAASESYGRRPWAVRRFFQSEIGASIANTVVLPIRAWLVSRNLRKVLEQECPDVVHALRIPIEAMICVFAGATPLVTSVWGNDFTLYASKSSVQAALTATVLKKSVALMADCNVDLVRAKSAGFAANRPTLSLPGNGGLPEEYGCNINSLRASARAKYGISDDDFVVLNIRGFRRYIRNDIFFEASRRLIARLPNVKVLCVGMAGWIVAEEVRRECSDPGAFILTGPLSVSETQEIYSLSDVSVSLSTHDGTPNTLLEAMACGVLPICGDLPSIREWLEDGKNGILVDVKSVEAVEKAVVRSWQDSEFRKTAAGLNREIIDRCARRNKRMTECLDIYRIAANIMLQGDL